MKSVVTTHSLKSAERDSNPRMLDLVPPFYIENQPVPLLVTNPDNRILGVIELKNSKAVHFFQMMEKKIYL